MPGPASEVIVPEVLSSVPERALAPRIDDALTEFANPLGGIHRAIAIANELDGIIKKKNWAVRIKGSERPHLKIEAWTTLAMLCGCAPGIERVERDEWGFQAKAELIRLATGERISSAFNRCDFDETLPRRDGTTYKRWDESHAVLSMSQTRAISKVCSVVLRFIPELVGYSGTPAEDMPGKMEVDSGARVGTQREVRAGNSSGDRQAQPARASGSDEMDWLDEEMGGKKFAGKTWRHMAEGSYGGERWGYLSWIVEKADKMKPETKRRARVLLEGYEAAHNASNPAADAAPADPAWDAPSE